MKSYRIYQIGDKIQNSIHGEFEVMEIYDDRYIALAGESWTWSGHVEDLEENGFVVEGKDKNEK